MMWSWASSEKERKKVDILEMIYLRMICGVKGIAHVRNDSVRKG